MRLKLSLLGIGVFSHSGSRVWVLFLPSGPIWTVRSSNDSSSVNASSFLPDTKSANDGPVFSRSLKVVTGLGVEDVVAGGGGSLIVVAKQRFCGISEDRVSYMADEIRRLVGGRRAAITERRGWRCECSC